MNISKTKHKYDCTINYIVTDNLCTICANNPINIDNNPYLLGGRQQCSKCNSSVCECIHYINYNSLIK